MPRWTPKKFHADRASAKAAFAGLTGLLAMTPAAHAQEAVDGVPLVEVIVTAERVETALRRTPVSVGVVGREEIERRSISQLSDLAGTVAGVTVPNGFSNMPQAVGIRGVGVSVPAMSQAVGLYVDDVPLVRGYATALWDLPDVERIEVLRGPQGTLYGENSTAGAVKIVSLDPVRAPAGWLQAGAGNYGALEAKAYVTGQVGDGPLAASLAVTHRQNDGYARNDTLHKRVNRLDFTQFRTKLRYAPSGDFDAVLAIDGLDDRSDTNTANYPLNDPRAAPRVTFTSFTDGPFKRQAGGVEAKLRQRLAPNLDFRSITAWRTYRDNPAIGDFGGLQQERFGIDQNVKQDAWSQEFQWQKIGGTTTWTGGAIAVRDSFDFHRWTTTYALAAPAPSYSEAWSKLFTTDLGVYGQLRQAIDDSDSVTFGLRGYRTEQTGSNRFWKTNAAHDRLATIYDAPDLATRSSGVLPRVSLERQFDPQTFGYASLSKGAKFGGFNRAANSLFAAEYRTHPEHVTAYEVGGKWRSVSGLATAQVAAFYNDYRDYLASLANTTLNGVQVTDTVLLNAGKAKTYGVDLDAAAKLNDGLEWNVSLEILRSRFDQFLSTASGANYVGNELPYASHFSGGTAVHYVTVLPAIGRLSLDASLQHLAAQFSDVANTGLLQIRSQTYVNFGSSLAVADSAWSVSLVIRNAFNRTQALIHQTVPSLGLDAVAWNTPRTVAVSARREF